MKVSATENYPIFAYSNDTEKWAKLYKPLEYKRTDKNGKKVNFKHGYLGNEEKNYIHGLDRVLKEVKEKRILQLNKLLYKSTSKAEKDQFKEELENLQVNSIIICSGASDGLNVAALSDKFYPIWLNSEGEQLNYEQYKRLSKLCKHFYNLPDIDNAGLKFAYQLSNKYWNLKTIFLPKSKIENGKDFRDWLKYYFKADKDTIKRQFDNLLKVALKCNFIEKNENARLTINLSHFHYFLKANNYYSYKPKLNLIDKSNEDSAFLIKIEENYKVSIPEVNEIRSFCIEYLKEKGVDLEAINLLKKSRSFSSTELKTIDRINLDFKSHTDDSQSFFFLNGIVNVSDNDIRLSTQVSNKYVWSHKVIKGNFIKKDNFFEYYKDESGNNRVKILDTSCDFMCYIMNGSRVF